MAVMTSDKFVELAKNVATNYKTLYVMGCFGSPLNATNKKRYCNNHAYNKKSKRTKLIMNASSNTFGFDCVCLLKALFWGWNGNVNSTYGGAKYGSNGVPDVGANTMFDKYCTDKSSDFRNIQVGEFVWLSGHIGVYIGNGLVVECTPIWKDGVQITALKNLGVKQGYNNRTWTKHGKSVFLEYVETKPNEPTKSIDDIAREVIDGKWGNGDNRKNNLKAAGYDYKAVQNRVNEILSNKKSIDTIAREVINGKWGNGQDRKNRLTKAGYNYNEVQKKVNELLR